MPIKDALPDWQLPFSSSDYVTNTEIALFSEMSYELNDKWKMRLGGRLNQIVKEQTSWVLDINHLSTLTDVYATEQDYLDTIDPDSSTFEHFTGRAIFDYKHSDSQFFYFGYNRGLKAGGYNPATDVNSTITVVDPELHDMFEVGNRQTLFGGNLLINSHLFLNSVDGMQLQRLVGLATETFNADASINGLEMDFLAKLTSWLRIDGNISLTDATIGNYSSINPRNPYGATSVELLDDTTVYTATVTDMLADTTTYGTVISNIGGGDLATGTAILNAYSALGPIIIVGNTDVGYIYRSFGYTCDEIFSPLVGCGTTGDEQSLNGNRLPYVPEYTIRLGGGNGFN